MKFTLKIWRQPSAQVSGKFFTYEIADISPDMSVLELLDALNQQSILNNEEPIAFEHDCREGICGSCSLYINGRPHGVGTGSTTCQVYMRSYPDRSTLVIEPWRANAFPIIKDLIVDRSAFDRIVQAGGYITVDRDNIIDANAIPIAKANADTAFDAAMCIGCGACVAACKNSSAMLFVAAKVAHLSHLPQGEPARRERAQNTIAQMDREGFGSCSNTGSCAAICPKEISLDTIAHLNREYRASG